MRPCCVVSESLDALFEGGRVEDRPRGFICFRVRVSGSPGDGAFESAVGIDLSGKLGALVSSGATRRHRHR